MPSKKPEKRDSREMVFAERCQVEGPVFGPAPKGFVRVGEVLGGVMNSMGLREQGRFSRVQEEWENIVGRMLARHVVPDRLEWRVLFVRVSHPGFKMELQGSGMLAEMLRRVQALPGLADVKEIRMVVGAG